MQARWGWPIGIAALGFLLGAFLATQGVALHYDWRPALGRPWFHWGGVPFWGPLDYFKWRSIAEAAYPEPFKRFGLFMIAGGALGIFCGALTWRDLGQGGGVNWRRYACAGPILLGLAK